MARNGDNGAGGWRAFKRLPLLVQGLVWGLLGIGLALLVLSLDSDPVDEDAGGPLVAVPGPQSVAGSRTKPGDRQVPEDPRKKDPQLSSGSTPAEVGDYKVPKSFKATTEQVTKLFQATLGGRGRPGQNRNVLVDARCEAGDCRIEYVPDGQGTGRLIETQGVLWRALVKDPAWRSATIVVRPGGPDLVGPGGEKQTGAPPDFAGPPILTITCSRDAVLALSGKFGVQGTPDVRRRCEISANEAPGK